jgi:uncharacterized membrane protein
VFQGQFHPAGRRAAAIARRYDAPGSDALLDPSLQSEAHVVIGIGAWLGTIMLFNVWALIWPNQKKVIGVVEATADEKAKARRIATLTSRVNFLLSVPMLLCMGGQSHGLPF